MGCTKQLLAVGLRFELFEAPGSFRGLFLLRAADKKEIDTMKDFRSLEAWKRFHQLTLNIYTQ
jgi:hypothetical protein